MSRSHCIVGAEQEGELCAMSCTLTECWDLNNCPQLMLMLMPGQAPYTIPCDDGRFRAHLFHLFHLLPLPLPVSDPAGHNFFTNLGTPSACTMGVGRVRKAVPSPSLPSSSSIARDCGRFLIPVDVSS